MRFKESLLNNNSFADSSIKRSYTIFINDNN